MKFLTITAAIFTSLVHCLPVFHQFPSHFCETVINLSQPGIPQSFDAGMESKLRDLEVAPYEDVPGYARRKFNVSPWADVQGACNTR
jgi:hypothetical protein